MDQTDSALLTWKIPDFAKLSSTKSPLFSNTKDGVFLCKQAQFGLRIEFCRETDHSFESNFCEINLSRNWDGDNDSDLTVRWMTFLFNQNGDVCLFRDIETGYSATSQCHPVFGGLFRVDLDFILDPSNGLLTDGSLIINSQVTVLGKSLKINLRKFNLNALKSLENYESLLKSSKHSDVVFVVGKDKDSSKEFSLHKAILSARSPVFSRMIDQSDSVEAQQNRIEITDIEVDVFEQLLNFIYSGNISSLEKYAADLLVASDKYQLDSLKRLCMQTLFTTTSSLTVDNVAAVLTLAEKYDADVLKSKCIEFITANASKVIDTEAWNQLPMNRELFNELYRDMARPNKK